VADLQKQLSNTFIRSPIDGVLDNVYFEEGTLMSTGMKAADLLAGGIKMTAVVPEQDIVRLKVGENAVVFIDIYPGKTFNAVIDRIALGSSGSFNYAVELTMKASDRQIMPGMYASAKVEKSMGALLMIPRSALNGSMQAPEVFVYENGVAVKRQVGLGVKGDLYVEVKSGIADKEEVITEGKINLTDGTAVHTAAGA
jgi:RND family efflux transporter MFP subunit